MRALRGLAILGLLAPSVFGILWPQCDSDVSTCDNPVCPDCDLVDCFPELEQEMCPEGYALTEGFSFGGCCPACVKYMDYDGEDKAKKRL